MNCKIMLCLVYASWVLVFMQSMYSRVQNKRTPMFINFFLNFQGLRSYYLKDFYYISLHILFFLSNFPEDTFIQGATSIPDSRVVEHLEL